MILDAGVVRTSYDEVPYESFPFPQTHPQRLATLGRLFGLRPPEPARCRVPELGCAGGGNLIPMALALPDAQVTGVDLSAVQVADGQKAIAALGLANIRPRAVSITDVDAGFGEFDYIRVHGVYPWVPNAVQEKMLAICAERLRAAGIAYIVSLFHAADTTPKSGITSAGFTGRARCCLGCPGGVWYLHQ